jgi:hypothetical protein
MSKEGGKRKTQEEFGSKLRKTQEEFTPKR